MGFKEARTRFAPSPTGELHIGGLRTALSSFLYARKNNGKFILRIEDTDRSRLVEGAIERIIKSLDWAGINIDEGVKLDKNDNVAETGKYGPYIQSERLSIYKKYIQKLLDDGRAYYCFCSGERLERMRKEQQKNKLAPKYDRHCLGLPKEEIKKRIENGEKYVVRFKIPEGETVFNDLVYGEIKVNNDTLDDQIIMKSDGFPTYHLAVVVDDYLMKITHIFRGAEWIASTPKHILLYEAFGWQKDMPEFAHMPNILNKNKKKLSKREGSVSVEDFKQQGYSAEAIINFIALLGWNPKTEQEIFLMDELIEQYEIEKVNRAGAVFDLQRLDWISSQHIKKMSIDNLYKQALPFLEKKYFYKEWIQNSDLSDNERMKFIKKILSVEQSRLEKFTQVGENNQFFFDGNFEIKHNDIRWKNSSAKETKENLKKAKSTLEKIPKNKWSLTNIEKKLLSLAGEKRGDLLFPLRAVLTGQKKSPSPFEVAWVLGKKESINRIKRALEEI